MTGAYLVKTGENHIITSTKHAWDVERMERDYCTMDDFVFEGSKESVRKQIGMAVPPKGAQIIIEAILKTFAGLPYRSVPAKTTNNNGNGIVQEKFF